MKQRVNFGRILALLLSFAMIFSTVQFNWLAVYAGEPEDSKVTAEESADNADVSEKQAKSKQGTVQDAESKDEAAPTAGASDKGSTDNNDNGKDEKAEASDVSMPAQTLKAKSGNGVTVNVQIDKGVFPEDVSLIVRAVSDDKAVEMAEEALGKKADITDAKAVDISFVRVENGKRVTVQPAKENGVHVKLSLSDALEGDDFVVLHEKHDGDVEKIDADTTAKKAEFDGNEFSIYAIVAQGEEGYVARRTYEFYKGNTLLYTQYPINKYVEAEKVDRWSRCGNQDESEVEYKLLEKMVLICHANPYWLFDPDCEAYYAEDGLKAEVVLMGDEPSVYAPVDVILRWINEGKPKITCWEDGRA